MRFHCNTTSDETIQYLRDQAIRAKQPPAVIDALDRLASVEDVERDLEERDEELSKMEESRGDLYQELETLVEHMQTACDIIESIHDKPAEAATFFDFGDLKTLQRQLSFAQKALERHKDS